MIEKEPDFILLGFMDLQKSVASAVKVDENTADKRLVFGEISNATLDEEGESLIQKSLDWSYFDDKGWIKYEHVQNNPDHIIGCPHSRITKDNRTIVKGAILKGKKFSDSVWELIGSIEQHNRDFPENQRTLGWSIEGSYTDTKKSKGGIRKAKVINVVITPNPVNKSTYLKMVEDNHKMVAKAMTAGNVNSEITDKVDVDAIAGKKKKDDIDKNLKSTAEDIDGKKDKKKKKSKTKSEKSKQENDMFKSFDEAKQFYLDNKVEEVEAERLAKAMFPEEDDDGKTEDNLEEENNSLLKGIVAKFAELKETITKSKATPEVIDGDGNGDGDGDDLDGDQEFIEVGDVLNGISKSISDLIDFSHQKAEYDYERDEAFAKAIMQVEKLEKSLEVITNGLTVTVGDKEIPMAKAVEYLIKSPSGNTNLDDVKIVGDQVEKSEVLTRLANMKWGELNSILQKGVAAKLINVNEQTLAESAHRTKEFKTIEPILAKCEAVKSE